jgi:hypothetical protein
MNHEDLLWRRVAALRGIDLPKRGERAHISGDRFHVQLAGVHPTKRPLMDQVSRLAGEAGCRGVIGEIVARPAARARTARVIRADAIPALAERRPTQPHGWRVEVLDREPERRRRTTQPLGWRIGLVEREAERLRLSQPDRAEG